MFRSKSEEKIFNILKEKNIKHSYEKGKIEYEWKEIKYYTPDQDHAFCDAYCSNEWYSKTFEKMKANKNQTKND